MSKRLRYNFSERWYSESTRKSNSNLRMFTSVSDANYPPTDKFGDQRYEFPQYGMLIEEPKKPPLLFTPEHDELLFLIEKLRLLPKNPFRVVVNLDDHDDFWLGGRNNPEINAANWGGHGILKGYWETVIHVSSRKLPYYTYNGSSDLLSLALYDPGDVALTIQNFIGQWPYILTIDADEHSQFDENPHSDDDKRFFQHNFREFISLLVTTITPELIHFTPSPVFTPPDGARKAWEIVRKAYQNM